MNTLAPRLRFAIVLLPFVAACGSSIKSSAPAVRPSAPVPQAAVKPVTPPPPQPSPERVVDDPVLKLLADSDQHFKAGQRQLELGHVERARQEFDQAVNLL